MNLIFTLFFMSKMDVITKPSYTANTCYKIVNTEWRPDTIKIINVTKTNYEYKVWLNTKWSEKFVNSFDTIERNYENNTICP